ncbi:MAG: hypothetical protein FWC70_12425 [Defluviitaleaceae bacterium]|nr:hypothetical protein [Defluviitaleaceae bacterium]
MKKIKFATKKVLCITLAALFAFFAVNPPVTSHAHPAVIAVPKIVDGLNILVNVGGGVSVSGTPGITPTCANRCASCLIGMSCVAAFAPSGSQASNEVAQWKALQNRRIEDAFAGKTPADINNLVRPITVQTPQGAIEIPTIPIQSTAADRDTMLTGVRPFWMNTRSMTDAATVGANYFFCFFAQDFIPVPQHVMSPHEMLLGIHSSGLPILNLGISMSGPNVQWVRDVTDAQAIYLANVLRRFAVTSYSYNGQMRTVGTYWGVGSLYYAVFTGGHRISNRRVGAGWEVLGFYINSFGRIFLASINTMHVNGEDRLSLVVRELLEWNPYMPIQKPITADMIFPPGPGIGMRLNTNPTNILDNLAQTVTQIRSIAGATDADSPVVGLVPVIDREAFPQVSDAAWPSFAQMLQDALTRQQLILDQAAAAQLIADGAVVNITVVNDPPVIPPFPDIDLSGIMALLRSIIDILRWIPGAITSVSVAAINNVGTSVNNVRTAVQAVPGAITNVLSPPLNAIRDTASNILQTVTAIPGAITGFFEPIIDSFRDRLEEMRSRVRALPGAIAHAISRIAVGSMNFDISRFQEARGWQYVFPLSIPWDLRNLIYTIFGGSVDARPAPVFTIDFTSAGFDAVVEFDMADYEPIAQVLRWGIVVMFTIGWFVVLSKIIRT